MSAVSRSLVALGMMTSVYAGVRMVSLESQAGNTVAEAFYNRMGLLGIGLALLLLAIFIALESAREVRESFVGAAAQCPSCRQIISKQAEVCPYCRVRLGARAATDPLRTGSGGLE